MSLFNFVESNIKECPELLLLSDQKQKVDYNNLYNFYLNKEKRYPIQSFVDIMMYDSLCRCSTNVIEYELLRQKTRKISSLLQAKFDLTMASNFK